MKKLLALIFVTLIMAGCVAKAPSGASPSASDSPFKNTPGYVLNFSDEFKPGMNAVDEFGISLVIAVDVSGSMGSSPGTGGQAKYIQATKALSTVTSYLEALSKKQKDLKIQVAILKFSTSVHTVLPMTLLDEEGLMKLKVVSSDPKFFEPDGNTAIGKAIEKGSEMLAMSGTVFNSLIIVTDGESNISPSPDEVMRAVYSDRNSATTKDFKVITSTQLMSFIGFDVQSSQFNDFHDLGGRVMSADNQSELEASLKSLLEADITKLEG